MSRSYKKQAYMPHPLGYGGDSEKTGKRIWHRRMRAQCRVCIQKALRQNELDVFLPSANQVGNVRDWTMGKEGKRRFDPRKFPEFMRK